MEFLINLILNCRLIIVHDACAAFEDMTFVTIVVRKYIFIWIIKFSAVTAQYWFVLNFLIMNIIRVISLALWNIQLFDFLELKLRIKTYFRILEA